MRIIWLYEMYNFIWKLRAINSAKLQGKEPTHRNQLCFQKCNKPPGKEIKKVIPFTTASKRLQYLGNTDLEKNPRRRKDLHAENYKTLQKESKDLNKWEDIPRSEIGTLNTVKMALSPKEMYSPM